MEKIIYCKKNLKSFKLKNNILFKKFFYKFRLKDNRQLK